MAECADPEMRGPRVHPHRFGACRPEPEGSGRARFRRPIAALTTAMAAMAAAPIFRSSFDHHHPNPCESPDTTDDR